MEGASMDIFFSLKYVQSQPVTLQTDILMDVRAFWPMTKAWKDWEKSALSQFCIWLSRDTIQCSKLML